MLASALESACDIILTEDMHDGQMIDACFIKRRRKKRRRDGVVLRRGIERGDHCGRSGDRGHKQQDDGCQDHSRAGKNRRGYRRIWGITGVGPGDAGESFRVF